jgi:DNA-binding response OmpR family regulator
MRILVLEDSAQMRDVIARALRRAGYVVSTASQGNENTRPNFSASRLIWL